MEKHALARWYKSNQTNIQYEEKHFMPTDRYDDGLVILQSTISSKHLDSLNANLTDAVRKRVVNESQDNDLKLTTKSL